ncbi:MAG: HAMP domain-containing histidine kinase [candidate division Zixibacteria bacterium]|nr:HAMP domain-containing histidine kinase [candidate division Zixibacteria bacterium]
MSMFARHRTTVLLLLTVGLIILVNLAWWLFYDRTERLLDQQLSRRLAAIAATGAVSLQAEQVTLLSEGDIEAYSGIIGILEDIRLSDSLSEVFIVDGDYHYLATTSLEPDSVYFLAALNAPYIDSAFLGLRDEPVATPSYRTGDIYLKSAFVPLLDSTGYPQAVLGVEANVDYFDALADLRRNLYYSTGLSLAVGVIVTLLLLWAQRRINRAEQKLFLSQTHAYLGRMVAVVSHEVKNPLQIIRASAERLAKREKSEESGFIVDEVDRLNQLVTGYLNFAAPRTTLIGSESPESIRLADFLNNVRKHFADKYANAELEWDQAQTAPETVVTSYPRPLRQVLLNLLINGAEACRDAGKPVRLGLNAIDRRGSGVAIKVVDYGPGLSKKELKRVFDPFYTSKKAGSGLGLYLSRKIVAEMGGQISINSTRDEKTEIIINLPGSPSN